MAIADRGESAYGMSLVPDGTGQGGETMMSQTLSTQDDPTVARFRGIDTSLVTDAFQRLGIYGWMDGVLPLVQGTRIAARARPLAFGPARRTGRLQANMYQIISRINPGEALVVGSGATHDNLLGSNMATFARRSGLAGIITDSKTRDRAELRELGLAVFSSGAAVWPPIHVEMRDFDVTVDCGGTQVRPGDIVVGDDDGVVVIRADRAGEVLYQIEDIAKADTALAETIRKGGTLDEILAKAVAKRKVRE